MKFFPHGFSTLHCGGDDGSAAPLRPPKDWAGWGSWVEHSMSVVEGGVGSLGGW